MIVARSTAMVEAVYAALIGGSSPFKKHPLIEQCHPGDEIFVAKAMLRLGRAND
jgi:hypothetical protein